MKISFPTALAAALMTALATAAFAQDSYPRLTGGADDMHVEYGPGPAANIVGGGAVSVVNEGEGQVRVTHSSPAYTQSRADGRVPVMLGGEDDHTVTWVAPQGGSLQAGRTGRPQG